MILALATAVNAWVAWQARRSAQSAHDQSQKNAAQIEQVHLATNSLQDKLVESTARESFRAGVDSQRGDA